MKTFIRILLFLPSYLIAQEWSQVGNTIHGTETDMKMHHVLSNDGRHLAVGSMFTDPIIQVYHLQGSNWVEKGGEINVGSFMKRPQVRSLNFNGTMVAIGGEVAGSFDKEGIVSVYEYNAVSDIWEKKGSDLVGNYYERLGVEIFLSYNGDDMIVAGDGSCCVGYGGPGKVYSYHWSGADWQKDSAVLVGENVDDEFGKRLYASSDNKIVAIEATNYQTATGIGKIYVYEKVGGLWQERNIDQMVPLNNVLNGIDLMGMSDSGNDIVVGYQNKVQVFSYDGVEYQPKGDSISFSDFYSSSDIDESGSILVLSYRGYMQDSTNQGKVKIYRWDGLDWLADTFEIVGENKNDNCGDNVQITANGNSISVNTLLEDELFNDAGAVRVYGNQLPLNEKENRITKTNFTIYPNPNQGEFTVKGLSQFDEIKIYNNLGVLVLERFAYSEREKIFTNLKQGLYFLEVYNNGRLTKQTKVVIQ